MVKVLRIKFCWSAWCRLTNLGYWLVGAAFLEARIGQSWNPLHALARMCWGIADNVFAVNDTDFMLAFPTGELGESDEE